LIKKLLEEEKVYESKKEIPRNLAKRIIETIIKMKVLSELIL